MRGRLLAVAAAVSMISLGSSALAQSAAPLSLANVERAGADTEEASFIRGGFIIPTLIVLAIIGGVYLITKDGDPESP
jgi:hypothetical protein